MFLSLTNIKKSFGQGDSRVEVLKGIDLSIEKGEFCVLLGPSGSGKSTLLRCATGLETADAGEIHYSGTFGLVFQNFNLFPHYSVMKNITDAPIKVQKRKKEEVYKEARELLKKMGLSDKEDYYPCQLSGGQCQRVAIARAIVGKPKLLLADEPTGALDSASGAAVMELFQQLHDGGSTIIMITHDHSIANHAAKVMTIRDGVLSGGDDYE